MADSDEQPDELSQEVRWIKIAVNLQAPIKFPKWAVDTSGFQQAERKMQVCDYFVVPDDFSEVETQLMLLGKVLASDLTKTFWCKQWAMDSAIALGYRRIGRIGRNKVAR